MSTVKNLDRLLHCYRGASQDQIALFLGAGVNGGSWASEHPACASWPELLKAISEYFRVDWQFKANDKGGDADWVELAGSVLKGKSRADCIRAIDAAIYSGVFRNSARRDQRPRKHKVLAWTVLKRMDTLRAAIGFSAAIHDPARTRSMCRHQTVGRVLTTNYDFFFGAAWPRYTSMRRSWWPVTWASTGTRQARAGPIVYLHGYLPYSEKGERDVVISRHDYDRAYSESVGDARGFALRHLTDAVHCCHLVFIGFSFSDERVREALQSDTSMQHFAFLCEDEPNAIEAAEKVGVAPIILPSWRWLPDILGRVYGAGLTKEESARVRMTKEQYWNALQLALEPR